MWKAKSRIVKVGRGAGNSIGVETGDTASANQNVAVKATAASLSSQNASQTHRIGTFSGHSRNQRVPHFGSGAN
jgi:hypothetical protein